VEKLVEELDLGEIDRLVVLNKSDLVPEAEIAALVRRFDGVAVSALRRRGFDALIQAAEERLGRKRPLLDTAATPAEPARRPGAEWVPEDFDPADYGVVDAEH